ncbi:CLUMA_CG010686, isoform A [Clunio marinus]|uniref:CLUMA_CG010686, isoform A n=1 Tax=Clunio marinus TaxID=568069 RepID=A0A1J1IAQ7_9DIPT|nr:CLUMA_CG010686, isoform A [Clunio marinus]
MKLKSSSSCINSKKQKSFFNIEQLQSEATSLISSSAIVALDDYEGCHPYRCNDIREISQQDKKK